MSTDSPTTTPAQPMSRNQLLLPSFQEAVKPAIKWLNENGNPHHKIIVEQDGAELVSGEIGFPTNEFLKD